MTESLLEVRNLKVSFRTEDGTVQAVDGVSLTLAEGETLGIVGESGSGKSVTMMSVMRLITDPNARIEGEVFYKGRDLMKLTQDQIRGIRGAGIAMIFQDPMTSLNPVYRVGWQIAEQIQAHDHVGKQAARARTIDLLKSVGIPHASERVDDYPHQFSGGMRQRVMIAMALSCNPDVVIADEPTTALDVTIQAQILDLMRELQETLGTAIILITHDMGVVAENADRVVVMYAGRKVEEADAKDLFEAPGHPYTKGLLGSIPNVEVAAQIRGRRPRLNEIKGMVPPLADLPQGCTFAPRCGFATDECRAAYPPLSQYRPRHWVACWHAGRVLGATA
jgi:oligopeptide/dipeptide ABC transporter ATP-binding protein